MEQDPNIPSGETGLPRLLRRRRRIGRNQRRYGGKSITGWAEYSSVPLQTTGDHSGSSRWAYVVLGVAAPLLPFFLFVIAAIGARDNFALTVWVSETNIAGLLLLFCAPFVLFAALLLIGTKVRIWLEGRLATRRPVRTDQQDEA